MMKVMHGNPGSSLHFHWSSVDCTTAVTPAQQITPGCEGGSLHKANEQETCSPPRDRLQHAACRVGRYVYVFGGVGQRRSLKDLWRLDLVRAVWENLSSWNVRLPHLLSHSMTAYKSQIFIFGGTFSDSEDTPLWILNTDLGCLRKYQPDPTKCARPTTRREHSCVVHKNCLYIYGGFLDDSSSTDEFWAFNIEEERWRMIRSHKAGKRHGHVAVVFGNHMWLHGGMRSLKHLSDLWTFNFSMCTWDAVKCVGASPSLHNHSAHVVGHQILLFGGFQRNGNSSNDVWIFNTDNVSWRQITLQQGDVCPPIALHASVLIGQDGGASSESTDRTQSVPELKRRSFKSGQSAVRPWTSPHPRQETNTLPHPAACLSYPHETKRCGKVDVLRLEATSNSVVIDGNNNASEEDLTNEAETSFLSISGQPVGSTQDSGIPDTLLSKSSQLLHNKRVGVQCQDFNQKEDSSSCVVQQRHKLRPASRELCGDGLPLLERFQSVNSDVDLGVHNLNFSLSDEQVHSSNKDFNSAKSNRETNGDQTAREPSESTFRQRELSKDSFLTSQDNIIGSTNRVRSYSFHNPLYDAALVAGSHTSTNNSLEQFFHPKGFKRSVSYSDVYGIENTPPSYSDMVLEDIEDCDMHKLFHKVDLAPPSNLSASLTVLTCRRASEQNIHYTRAALSENIRPWYNEHHKGGYSLESLLEKESPKHKRYRPIVSLQAHGQPKTAFKAGKYTKTTNHCSRHAAVIKAKNKCLSSSHLDNLVTANSVGTQTSTSQMCLSQPSQTATSATVTAATTSKSPLAESSWQQTSSQAQPQTGSTSDVPPSHCSSSIVGENQLCLLVLGGMTESSSFTYEPLKLWKCQLL